MMVWDDPPVEIEQIRGMVHTFAAKLDVPISRVDADKTLPPSPRGVVARHGIGGAVLLIDPAFDEYDDIEQEAVLAWTVVVLAVGRRSRALPSWALLIATCLAVLWPLNILYGVAGDAGVGTPDGPIDPIWLVLLGWGSLCVTGLLFWKPVSSVWQRWMIFRTDQEVVRAFGWDVMDALLAVDRPFLSDAALEQRMKRLDRLRADEGL